MNDSKNLNENTTTTSKEEKVVTNEQKNVNDSNAEHTETPKEENSVETPVQNNTNEKSKESENSNSETVVEAEKKAEEIEDKIVLDYLDKDFVIETMSVPTHSHLECRMVAYIMLWARRNGIKYEFDSYGNIYLTKGTLGDNEFYPCVTSHLDTVQDKQDPYILAGVPLDLKCELTKEGEHKLSVDSKGGTSIGIGADDKAGVTICLSMFNHFDKLKACFFLCEEIGCWGSKELDKDWFKDVGYVIGYDSPDLFRAAWSCSGVKLFSYEFYEKYMKPVCDEWGLENCFFSEPITDVMEIRKQCEIICMNFGNGGYNAHMPGEYCIMEHMDHACGMGVALIDHIGLTRHELKHRTSYNSKGTYAIKDGYYIRTDVDDTKQLESLGDNKRWGNRSSYNTNYNSTTKTTTSKEEIINSDIVKYIVNRYDAHINGLCEDVLEVVKNICSDSNIDFALFEEKIKNKFDNKIKF